MRVYVLTIMMVFSLALISAAADRYDNPAYGISVQTSNQWKIASQAALRINLHSLSDDQLAELFEAYRDNGVLRLKKEADRKPPLITVQFFTLPGKYESLTDYIRSLERNSPKNGYRVVTPTEYARLSGVPAIYLARVMRPGMVTHQYFVQRARSIVEIHCILPDTMTSNERDEALELVRTIRIDIDADKPEH